VAKKGKRKIDPGDVASNRRARHTYEILERFEAGLELTGSEVKSLRAGGAQIAEAYAAVEGGEAWLRGAHIPPYEPAAAQNHEPERPRKLLLHKREIERLAGQSQKKGLTVVPLRIYFKGPRAKAEIALARGKEQRDRRRELRDRDQQREIDRALSDRQRGR
jgi:SsrA-binding protein